MKQQPSRTELIQAIFESISAIKRNFAARRHFISEDCSIPPGQLEVFFRIYHEQPISFKQLAYQLQLTPGAISQLVEGLEQRKLITRKTDKADRRVQCLEMSPEGTQLIKRVEHHRQQMMEGVMAGLSDHELEVWLRIQKKLLEQLEIQRAEQHEKETA